MAFLCKDNAEHPYVKTMSKSLAWWTAKDGALKY